MNPTATIYHGEALEVLRTLPDESVHCCVTSPPYYGLRDYGEDGQLGLEETPEEYVERLVGIMREVRRVLRSDGTAWLNLGDSYNSGTRWSGGGENAQARNTLRIDSGETRPHLEGLKHKDMIGIPWMVAFALRADGWWLRQDIIWAKRNVMPESVTDRCTKAHEYLFLLTKSARYYYDAEAIAEQSAQSTLDRAYLGKRDLGPKQRSQIEEGMHGASDSLRDYSRPTRNKRSVWMVNTVPYKNAHFAVMPPKLVEPCILAGTSEEGCCAACGAPWARVVEREEGKEATRGKQSWTFGSGTMQRDNPGGGIGLLSGKTKTTGWEPSCSCPSVDPVPCTVLDPFSGAGTTGLVALSKSRHYVGVELNAEYVEMSRRRIQSASPLFFTVDVASAVAA